MRIMKPNTLHRTILIVLLAVAFPAASFAGFFGVGVSVGFPPPAMPVYAQPVCPGAGYIWTPGYWAFSDDQEGYYWVPGTWVMSPEPGLLWTPGYWGFIGGEYLWHDGYWGPHVGFYGGINYGFGYFGTGFVGGYWQGSNFFYNRAVMNVSNVNVTNIYNRTVQNGNYYGNRASFNGPNGVQAGPSRTDMIAAREPHYGLTTPQRSQAAGARTIPSLQASANHGSPQIAATQRPGAFDGRASTAAHGAQPAYTHGAPGGYGRPSYQPARTGGYQGSPQYQSHQTPRSTGGYQGSPHYQSYQTPRSTGGYQASSTSGYQAAHNYGGQAPRNYGYQAQHNAGGYQAPRNAGSYQAPRNYGYQAPHNAGGYQAPRNYGNQAPRSAPQPHYSAPGRRM